MMRGIVNTDLNERERPTVNSRIMQFYKAGDIVQIVDTVLGDPFDGDDVWFKLSNGAFVWNAAIDVDVDCSKLSDEDKNQWLICYRQVDQQGRPDMFSKMAPKSLYFTPVRLPADSASIRVNDLVPDFFAEGVFQSVVNLKNPRKHVFVYIHGYQLLSSLKLDLLGSFVQNYMSQPLNNIAKVLFMSWPAQGGPSRKTVDDRSLKAGQEFVANGLFETFEKLSDKLKSRNKTLNLIVHSFGHQLLNGMLNPAAGEPDLLPNKKVFDNIFLMAPDITHLTVKTGGETIKNYFQDNDGIDFHYDFTKLKQIANNVHVFHDKYDYLLYSSTKKFVGMGNLNNVATPEARFTLTKNYRNLGNFGDKIPEPIDRVQGINFFHVDDIAGDDEPTNDFPFRRIRRSARKKVDDVWTNADYGGINTGSIVFNLKRFPTHHRYLFTSKTIVDRVLSLLS
ncbi:alpha/beta hydrolase [Dyadobacter sp. CY323]|uniref:alpha/beta hydrolase n=1 Tax=Dyadobacter sp. CY323 TaxID=2907302 RepID=UPI001F2C041B|nr:alpha/beta hydrolase [Dyadobacter sp. CY323]MCE6989621.1 alpha/beta hydrolase [Dyadobacter sp. CY323]